MPLFNLAWKMSFFWDGRAQALMPIQDHTEMDETLDRVTVNLAKHPDGGVPLTAEDQAAPVAFLKTLSEEQRRRTKNAARK